MSTVCVQVEAERRARKVIVPTDPDQVKLRLRELGHPVCLFGEDVRWSVGRGCAAAVGCVQQFAVVAVTLLRLLSRRLGVCAVLAPPGIRASGASKVGDGDVRGTGRAGSEGGGGCGRRSCHRCCRGCRRCSNFCARRAGAVLHTRQRRAGRHAQLFCGVFVPKVRARWKGVRGGARSCDATLRRRCCCVACTRGSRPCLPVPQLPQIIALILADAVSGVCMCVCACVYAAVCFLRPRLDVGCWSIPTVLCRVVVARSGLRSG